MTTISLLQSQDVAALKCIYFQLVKLFKEINWYGINCDYQQYEKDINTSFIYLSIIESGCPLTHPFECQIKNFITKHSSFCTFISDKCDSKITIYEFYNLATEDNDSLITEDNQNIQYL